MLLPVELDHRVVHAQQHLDVVGPLHALAPHAARPGVVDALLHAAVQRLQVHQAAEVSTCTGNRGRSLADVEMLKKSSFYLPSADNDALLLHLTPCLPPPTGLACRLQVY